MCNFASKNKVIRMITKLREMKNCVLKAFLLTVTAMLCSVGLHAQTHGVLYGVETEGNGVVTVASQVDFAGDAKAFVNVKFCLGRLL